MMNSRETLEDTSPNKKEALLLRIFPQNNSLAKVTHFKVKGNKILFKHTFFFKNKIIGPSEKCCFKEKDQITCKSFQDTRKKVEKVYFLQKAANPVDDEEHF